MLLGAVLIRTLVRGFVSLFIYFSYCQAIFNFAEFVVVSSSPIVSSVSLGFNPDCSLPSCSSFVFMTSFMDKFSEGNINAWTDGEKYLDEHYGDRVRETNAYDAEWN